MRLFRRTPLRFTEASAVAGAAVRDVTAERARLEATVQAARGGEELTWAYFPHHGVLVLPNTNGKFRDDARAALIPELQRLGTSTWLSQGHLVLGAGERYAARCGTVGSAAMPVCVLQRQLPPLVEQALQLCTAAAAEGTRPAVHFVRAAEPFFFLINGVADASIAATSMAFPAPFPAAGSAHMRQPTSDLFLTLHAKMAVGATFGLWTDDEPLYRFAEKEAGRSKAFVTWESITADCAVQPRPTNDEQVRRPSYQMWLRKSAATDPAVVTQVARHAYNRPKIGPLAR
jgi:hypothetical protein